MSLANLPLRSQLHVDRLPLRLLTLAAGLTGYGVGLAMIIRSTWGADPWDVLHVALAERSGLSVGTVIIATSVLVLLAWIPLRQHVGLGTLANALWIGVAADAGLRLIPEAATPAGGLGLLIGGIVLNAVSDAVYIGAQLGPGPRDGLMTGIHHRWGLPIGPVRLALEAVVLAAGWLLGGPVGLGTVLYAASIGPIVHLVLPRVTIAVRVLPAPRGRTSPARSAASDPAPAPGDAAASAPPGPAPAGPASAPPRPPGAP
ncbi:membrane protein YczE [Brachybacterium hainanense]|uniref:YitT family protein n=1 Tax=Brachybacterium hainanense TaxID=1541174 RepID=A0ABV6R7B6_9MICO